MSAPLSTRYQQPLTFGATLDESIQLFRRRWLTLISIQLVTIIPYVVVIAVLGAVGFVAFTSGAVAGLYQVGNNPAALAAIIGTALSAGLVIGLIFAACQEIAHGAAILTTDAAMRNQERSAGSALGTALRRVLMLFGAVFLLLLGVTGLAIVSAPLLVLSILFPLTILALLVWAANPGARSTWLKWFIILTTPFGLVIYYATRWSLYALPIMLEDLGPLRSIRRSAELVSSRWFRTWGVLLAVGLIAAVLQAIPSGLVGLVVAVLFLGSGQSSAPPSIAAQIINNAAGLIGWVLFGGLVFVGTTVLYHDLRNRREGADIAERIDLRTSPSSED
jgi:hypothetical protein